MKQIQYQVLLQAFGTEYLGDIVHDIMNPIMLFPYSDS
jgi:hypothetical protein